MSNITQLFPSQSAPVAAAPTNPITVRNWNSFSYSIRAPRLCPTMFSKSFGAAYALFPAAITCPLCDGLVISSFGINRLNIHGRST